MKTYERVYSLVKKIPKGKVSTYGQIGQMLGLNPRVVGWALNRLAKNNVSGCRSMGVSEYKIKRERVIPWQRVINSKGSISTNRLPNIPLDLQKKLLEREGVKFNKEGKTDLKKYLWRRLYISK